LLIILKFYTAISDTTRNETECIKILKPKDLHIASIFFFESAYIYIYEMPLTRSAKWQAVTTQKDHPCVLIKTQQQKTVTAGK
jgi:hypothetical protein